MSDTIDVRIPDIGDFKDVPVIEVLVKPGATIKKNDSLIVLETEKASMEIPSPADGTVVAINVKPDDKVAEGTVILTLQPAAGTAAPAAAPAPAPEPAAAPAPAAAAVVPPALAAAVAPPAPAVAVAPATSEITHASPSVRRFARELGVELPALRGSGPNGRVTRDDVQGYVKSALQGGAASAVGGNLPGLPPWPKIDFAQFGEIERTPLSRIKKLSGPALHRNWVQIPHITNYDEADITDLEAFRNEINAEQVKSGGVKLTMLAFLVKASVAALKQFPDFNASLDGDALVLKHYYNIGFAADTPNGLVVPVLKGADKKGLLEIGAQTAELGKKARDGKLGMAEMQGGSFTISSIGSIGGTQFTQIVNAPEVAILGATRAAIKPVWDGKQFVPRLIQPISVSYDHRVIDGAAAARFLVYLAATLHDFRRVAL
ncbi:MAG TPA: dihydrolipoyllysine-residue acetyltransferase [Candidatus Baltobacteraceae bacterium]